MIGSPESWPAIERLFHEAIELPPAERVALLDRIATSDPALRTSLQRLLDAHDEPAVFLDQLDHARAAELLEPGASSTRHPEWIGRYRVLRQLGRGGMGVVYLAEDPRLGRPVALKLLPLYVRADPRAERLLLDEARAACALDHPNIATIYEVAQADDGRPFIAMAFYDGVTLRARLQHGPVPTAEAIQFCTRIADGLAAAHARGVVHRDIKPENVLITTDGRVKILDFGLARMGEDAGAGTGTVRGTIAYMSPEQVRGEPGDARSDVWSLGVVLHELLAGTRPFTGDESTVLHSIVSADPAPLPTSLPPQLAGVVERCLRKLPAERYQSAGALREALVLSVPRRQNARVLAAMALTAGAGMLAFLGWPTQHSTDPGITVSNVRQLTRAPEPEVDPVLSPDGEFLAYSAGWAGQRKLVVRDLRRGRDVVLTRDIPGSHYGARWTPDGENVVFHTDGRSTGWPGWSGYDAANSRIPRRGGAAVPFSHGRVWDFFGDAILSTVPGSLLLHDRPGMTPRRIAGSGLVLHSASFSPDGSRVVYVEGGADVAAGTWSIGNVESSGIRIVPTAGGDVVRVTTDLHRNASPVWLPDGRGLLFVSNRDGAGDIYMLRLASDGRPAGDPVRVTTGLEPQTISISADGRTVAFSRFFVRRNVWAVDIPERGSISVAAARPVTIGNQRAENHGVTPDGRILLFDSNLEGNQDIFIMAIGDGEPRRLTRHPGDDFHPDLSPDGRTVAFYSTRFGTRDLFLTDVAGGPVTRLTSDPTEEAHPTFSPDGNALCFEVRGGADQPQPIVAVMTRVHSGAPWSKPLRIGSGWSPQWSPDGDQLVYEADRGVVIATLAGEERLLVPRTWNGFAWPHWAADGVVYFVGADDAGANGIFAVPADGGAPRMVVRLDDQRFKAEYGLSVAGNTLFLSLTEYESDIWMMNLDLD